ncbi:MAG TPA: putative molybdenum carrier protein [Pyrinomonadaceae bacterium]|nr:putative molybdenum carrier protein [Pyrinomonadaceae bacterium]
MKVRKIISGGQTGVDRAALDLAPENGIETGGYVPRGRQAEDGLIPEKYPNLIETETDDPAQRTELNVLHSDATMIIFRNALAGGSKLTAEFAEKYKKPLLHIDLSSGDLETLFREAQKWLGKINGEILNIAGPRASEDTEIYSKAKQFLERLFSDR